MSTSKSNTPMKGIILSLSAGILMGFFFRFVAGSMIQDYSNPEIGKLTSYTAVFVLSAGIIISNLIWNTYLMYKMGWSGINIDLNKTSIDLFKLARPNDINLNLAISEANKKIKVYQTKDLGKMNTINLKFASFFLKNYHVRESCSYNLNDILYKYNTSKNNRFELIDIDVEGSEYQILKSLNFKKYSFKLILVETHIFNLDFKQESDKIHILLKSKNYNYLKNFGETSVYENAEG